MSGTAYPKFVQHALQTTQILQEKNQKQALRIRKARFPIVRKFVSLEIFSSFSNLGTSYDLLVGTPPPRRAKSRTCSLKNTQIVVERNSGSQIPSIGFPNNSNTPRKTPGTNSVSTKISIPNILKIHVFCTFFS